MRVSKVMFQHLTVNLNSNCDYYFYYYIEIKSKISVIFFGEGHKILGVRTNNNFSVKIKLLPRGQKQTILHCKGKKTTSRSKSDHNLNFRVKMLPQCQARTASSRPKSKYVLSVTHCLKIRIHL